MLKAPLAPRARGPDSHPRSPAAEAYRTVRTSVEFLPLPIHTSRPIVTGT